MAVTMFKNNPLPICLFLVIGLLAVAGCSKPKSSYDYLNQARQDRQDGKDQAAIIDLKNALQKDPRNGEARYLLAVILNGHGEGSAAEIELRKAMDLGVNKSYIAAAMGQALLLQQQYQKIIDTIEVASDDKGKVAADINNVRGEAYLALRKADEAKAAFDKALKEYPESADAYLGMAQLAATRNDLEGSLHQIDIALSKDANSIKGWLMKASLLRAQNKDEEARGAYNHILQIDKSNVTARLGLASVEMAKNNLDAAKVQLDLALKIAPKDPAVRYLLAVAQFRRGNYSEALDSVQEVLKSVPDYMPSVLLHGAISYAKGSYELALNDLNRVIAQYPGSAYARRLLAATLFKVGKTDQAIETLQPLLKPESPDAQALALAGEIQLQAKNFVKATEYLQKAIELNPQTQQLRTPLAVSYLGAGDTEHGLKELEEAAKQAPGQSPADMIIIVTNLQRKDYDRALTAITNLEKKLGPNPVTYDLRGIALFGKQDVSDARKAFEQALAIQPTYFPATAKLVQLDLSDHKPDVARKRLEAVLEKEKNNLPAMMVLANLALDQKKGDEYVGWLERAIAAQPDALLPRVQLVHYYLGEKDNTKALSIAKDASKSFPNSAEAIDLLGFTQLTIGDKKDAAHTYSKMVQMVPNEPTAYLRLAQAQVGIEDINGARDSLNKALELKSEFPAAQNLLIRLDLAENRGNDALKLAQKIQSQYPKSPVGYDTEADILMAMKQYKQAAKLYEQALARGAGSAGLIQLHRALIVAGDNATAEQQLALWLKQHPADLVVRGYAGDFYMVNNRDRDAIAQYEAFLKIAPEQNKLAPLNNLASLYQREGDSHRALVTAEQAMKLAPNDPSVQDTLGWVLVQQGQISRALDVLRNAASKAPSAGVIRYHFAVALARSGRKDEARKELKAAIDAGQKFTELDDAKAMLKKL